jgi:hypothetical protein
MLFLVISVMNLDLMPFFLASDRALNIGRSLETKEEGALESIQLSILCLISEVISNVLLRILSAPCKTSVLCSGEEECDEFKPSIIDKAFVYL